MDTSQISPHPKTTAPPFPSRGDGRTLTAYPLAAIIKKRLDLPGSPYTLLRVLSVTPLEKVPISQALQQKDYTWPTLTDLD